jgi:hypothetical protein
MTFDPCVEHETLTRWEYDPRVFVYTRRCVRCGAVVHRLTQAELDRLPALDVPSALERHVGNRARKLPG